MVELTEAVDERNDNGEHSLVHYRYPHYIVRVNLHDLPPFQFLVVQHDGQRELHDTQNQSKDVDLLPPGPSFRLVNGISSSKEKDQGQWFKLHFKRQKKNEEKARKAQNSSFLALQWMDTEVN